MLPQVFGGNLICGGYLVYGANALSRTPLHVIFVIKIWVNEEVVDGVIERTHHPHWRNVAATGCVQRHKLSPEQASTLDDRFVDNLARLTLEIEFDWSPVEIRLHEIGCDLPLLTLGLLLLNGGDDLHLLWTRVAVWPEWLIQPKVQQRHIRRLHHSDSTHWIAMIDNTPEYLYQFKDLAKGHTKGGGRDRGVVTPVSTRIRILPHPVLVAIVELPSFLGIIREWLFILLCRL